MGGFPEDHEINVSNLIGLWVAEGFLKSNGSKDLEDLAEDYLEDLAKRSLVLINEKRYDGKIKAVKIHDLLRDLCIRKARDEDFFHVLTGSSPEVMGNSRRLSVLSTPDGLPEMDGSYLRTILLFYHWVIDSWKSFRLLRVVDALSVTQTSSLEEIGELLHLRYLRVTFRNEMGLYFIDVPESWSKLENLETLIIRHCRSRNSFTSYLLFGIWRWPKLRHLDMWHGESPDPCDETCDQIVTLKNLHTLKGLHDFVCCEKMLALIPNLKKLGIIYKYYSGTNRPIWSEYCLNNLVHLHKLEELSFDGGQRNYSHRHLIQNISFPLTLKKLTLSGTTIPWEDMSSVGSLPNLQVLKLKENACLGTVWETTEGEFSQLKQLLIELTDPYYWITESTHFPMLQRLSLYRCQDLIGIPDSIGEIPTLQLIQVFHCNPSIDEAAERIVEEQHSFGNDLQLHLQASSYSAWR